MKRRKHRDDEPTVLPAGSSGVIFHPDGTIELLLPRMDPDDVLDKGATNAMRVAMLFGDGEASEVLRGLVDAAIRLHGAGEEDGNPPGP